MPATGSTGSAAVAPDVDLPPGHRLERPSLASADEMLALVHACDIAAIGFADFTAAGVMAWLGAPFTSPDLDGWLVRDRHGRLVGGGYLSSSYGGSGETGSIFVHPDGDPALHRTLAQLIVARSAERAAAAGRPHHELVFWSRNEPLVARAVAEIGARKAHTFARLRRVLDGRDGRTPLPTGVTIVGVDHRDEAVMREVHAVHVEAFVGHYRFQPSTYEAWRARLAAVPEMPYEDWLVARADGSVVGIMQAGPSTTDGLGLIQVLAVLASHRGRGIAKALLDRAFAGFAARGYRSAEIGVDRDNQTGAFALYTSVGLRVLFDADAWELDVPAGGHGPGLADVGGRA